MLQYEHMHGTAEGVVGPAASRKVELSGGKRYTREETKTLFLTDYIDVYRYTTPVHMHSGVCRAAWGSGRWGTECEA